MTLSLAASLARAQMHPPRILSAPTEEEALLNEGFDLRSKGNDQAALAKFQKAYELSRGARALAQIALAEQALGHWTSAEAHLVEATAKADDPWIAKNKSLLDMALTDIQGHLGSLELSGGVGGAVVLIDGMPVGALPFQGPIRVPAGSVALEVRAPGYLPVLRTILVQGRGLTREAVVMVRAAVPTSPPANVYGVASEGTGPAGVTSQASPAPPPSSGWGVRKKVGLGLGIGAAAGLVVGTTFLVVQRGRADDFRDGGCTLADPAQSPSCQSLKDRADSASTFSVVGFVAAAVLGGVGTYLFLTDQQSGPTGVATARRAIALRCAPAAGASVSCFGEF